jgi:alpha-beta hydrolase superfamily lysophospholipase
MVLAPTGEAPPGGRPVLAWAHGTTGLADRCAPSTDGAGELGVLFASMLAEGYVVAATDYEGLGGPGLHPYLVGGSEGRSVLDAVRAARSLSEAGAGSQALIWGASQGGHAALWAGQLAAGYAPELALLGVVASAPASLAASRAATGPTGTAATAGFIPMIVAGYAAAYDDVDPATYLTPAALDHLDVVSQGCVREVFEAYADLGLAEIIVPEVLDASTGQVAGPLGDRLAENEPGASGIAAPVLMVQGSADEIVLPAGPMSIAERLCASGTTVDLRIYDGAGHIGVNLVSLPDVVAFAQERLAGTDPTSTCP